jgi:hypothetical protein
MSRSHLRHDETSSTNRGWLQRLAPRGKLALFTILLVLFLCMWGVAITGIGAIVGVPPLVPVARLQAAATPSQQSQMTPPTIGPATATGTATATHGHPPTHTPQPRATATTRPPTISTPTPPLFPLRPIHRRQVLFQLIHQPRLQPTRRPQGSSQLAGAMAFYGSRATSTRRTWRTLWASHQWCDPSQSKAASLEACPTRSRCAANAPPSSRRARPIKYRLAR